MIKSGGGGVPENLQKTLLMPILVYVSETMILRRRRGLGLEMCRWKTSEVC